MPSTAKKAMVIPFCVAKEMASLIRRRTSSRDSAVGAELDVAGGRFDHGCSQAEANQFLDVGANGAREAPELGLQVRLRHQLDGFGIFHGNARETGFDAADADLVELAGDLELLLWRQDDADGLFAVSQGGVVEADFGAGKCGANFRPRIQFTDPDFGICSGHRFSCTHQRMLSCVARAAGFSP